MTPYLYVLAATGVALVAFGVTVLVHLARDYAEDRGREQEYADQWRSIHEQNRKRP